jgi:hypothetical protein
MPPKQAAAEITLPTGIDVVAAAACERFPSDLTIALGTPCSPNERVRSIIGTQVIDH